MVPRKITLIGEPTGNCKLHWPSLPRAWNFIEETELFRHIHDPQGQYDARAHVAEMIALLGPPPRKVTCKVQVHGSGINGRKCSAKRRGGALHQLT